MDVLLEVLLLDEVAVGAQRLHHQIAQGHHPPLPQQLHPPLLQLPLHIVPAAHPEEIGVDGATVARRRRRPPLTPPLSATGPALAAAGAGVAAATGGAA